MRCGMRYALLAQRGVGAASCRCWCAPIECGPSAACTGELVTRLMCLVCAGTVAAALERMAQPDATEWLYWFWCKPPIGYRQHGLGRQLSQLQARSSPLRAPITTEMVVICVEPALCRCGMRYMYWLAAASERPARCCCALTDRRRRCLKAAASLSHVRGPTAFMLRCCGRGAARCDGVALTLVQADRVSPARTRTAAEATSGPIVVS